MAVNPLLVGIAGGTGSGKTTLCWEIVKCFGSDAVIIFHDMYYKALSHVPPEERCHHNFDHPDALDNDLFHRHLGALKFGKPVKMPEYDFLTHIRTGSVRIINPTEVILAEGIMLFADSRIRNRLDLKIFIDLDSDIRFIRRLNRDMKERGRDVDSIVEQYLSSVKPMHDQYVEPSKEYADLIVSEDNMDRARHMIIGIVNRMKNGQDQLNK